MRGDVARVVEADVRPRLAGVGRLPHRRRRARRCRGSSPRRRRRRPRPDRIGATATAPIGAAEEAVGDALPRLPAVGRLPDAAAGRAEVIDVRLIGDARRPRRRGRRDTARPRATEVLQQRDVLVGRRRFAVPHRRGGGKCEQSECSESCAHGAHVYHTWGRARARPTSTNGERHDAAKMAARLPRRR